MGSEGHGQSQARGPCEPLCHSRWGTKAGSGGTSDLCQDGSNHSTGRRRGGPGARRPQPTPTHSTHHLHGWREHHTIEANEVSVVKRMHGIDFPDEVVHGLWLAQHIRLQALHSHTHLPRVEIAQSQDRPQPPAPNTLSQSAPPSNEAQTSWLQICSSGWVSMSQVPWPGWGRAAG